jgi:hypothetical protein
MRDRYGKYLRACIEITVTFETGSIKKEGKFPSFYVMRSDSDELMGAADQTAISAHDLPYTRPPIDPGGSLRSLVQGGLLGHGVL